MSIDTANSTKRPEFLEKMMASTKPRYEPEVEEAERSLKEMRGAVPTPMLDIALRSGTVRSFSYAYLSEVEFEPGDTLTLKFTSGACVVIEGRGLARHRQQVRLHRADELRECSEGELASEPEDVPLIERIHITEGDNR